MAAEDPPCGRPGPGEAADAEVVRAGVRAAIDALPPQYRAVVALYYLDEMDLADVAQALDIPVGTAKVRLFRARNLLRRKLAALAGHDHREHDVEALRHAI